MRSNTELRTPVAVVVHAGGSSAAPAPRCSLAAVIEQRRADARMRAATAARRRSYRLCAVLLRVLRVLRVLRYLR